MQRRITIICFISLMVFSVVCSAQSSDEKDIAKEHFIKAREFFNDGNYIEAAQWFRKANQAKPSWKIQYNIGQAESAAKRYGLALQAFELYLADGGDEIPVERKDEVLAEIGRLRVMVASINVEGVDDAVVYVDGHRRGTIPLEGPIKVTAGKRHNIKVEKDDKVLLERKVRLSGGDDTTITVKAPEEPPPTIPVEKEETVEEPQDSTIEEDTPVEALEKDETKIDESAADDSSVVDNGKKMRVLGTVFMAGGAVAGLGGFILGGLSMAKANDVKELCDNDENICTTKEGHTAYDDAKGYGIGANILIPASAVIGTTGLILLIVGIKKKNESLSASVQPAFSNQVVGVSFSRGF